MRKHSIPTNKLVQVLAVYISPSCSPGKRPDLHSHMKTYHDGKEERNSYSCIGHIEINTSFIGNITAWKTVQPLIPATVSSILFWPSYVYSWQMQPLSQHCIPHCFIPLHLAVQLLGRNNHKIAEDSVCADLVDGKRVNLCFHVSFKRTPNLFLQCLFVWFKDPWYHRDVKFAVLFSVVSFFCISYWCGNIGHWISLIL